MKRLGPFVCLVLVGAFATVGCRAKADSDSDTTQADAEDGIDSSSAESDTESLSSSLIDDNGGSLGLATEGSLDYATGGISTQALGDFAKTKFLPAGCLTTALDEASKTVTYTFNECTGPHGHRHITGVVKAVYTIVDANTLNVSFTGTDLAINKATVDWSATANTTRSGTAYTMIWKGQFSGTTYRGREFSRTNDKTITWDTATKCITINGVSEGDVHKRNLRTEVKNLAKCEGECASGEIVITNLDNDKTLSLSLDGTGSATFTGPRGNSVTVTLACGAQ